MLGVCGDEIKKMLKGPFRLKFKGIDFFSTKLKDGKPDRSKGRVVYAKLKDDGNLKEVTDHLIKTFIEYGLTSEDQFDKIQKNTVTDMYEVKQVHLTLMKRHKNQSIKLGKIMDIKSF